MKVFFNGALHRKSDIFPLQPASYLGVDGLWVPNNVTAVVDVDMGEDTRENCESNYYNHK